jgi:hypothetical protein
VRRLQPSSVKWGEPAREARANIEAGLDDADRGELADLTADETEHYLETGELPERVERWLDSYDTRPRTWPAPARWASGLRTAPKIDPPRRHPQCAAHTPTGSRDDG